MPIYEYSCKKCGKQFEVFQGITEPDVKTCKFCKGKVQKMMSLSSFTLKGSGWYATDYASKKPQANKTEKSESSQSDRSTASDSSSGSSNAADE
jgi:putative FmdB family regulatory protein